ncbi:MAG: radical SAM family heme chaperone HemW [Candidatus Neomarinimicrobiota bacterium]|nr:MAG: radical SAM family heme chaperone HemW [Candidatus Neomarinimicrobiota bacterium]
MRTGGLYLHIPFCRHKCVYCDFYSVENRDADREVFIQALCRELSAPETPSTPIDSIFFGGGTPSLLTPADFERVLEVVRRHWNLTAEVEITVEANPGEVSLADLRAWVSLGIQRLSLGIQSFRDRHLRFLTRIHDAAEARRALKWAFQAGFENVNGDMIHTLPGQTVQEWETDLEELIDWGVCHISAYALTVEPQTPLAREVARGSIHLPPEDLAVSFLERTEQVLTGRGFRHYEISNYSRPGFACRHNLHYWNLEPYWGCGPSAHSFDGNRRWWNVRSLDTYLTRMQAGRSPVARGEVLSTRQKINEILGFGIRLEDGVNLNRLPAPWRARMRPRIDHARLKWEPYLQLEDGYLRLSGPGRLYADAIAVDLMVPEDSP